MSKFVASRTSLQKNIFQAERNDTDQKPGSILRKEDCWKKNHEEKENNFFLYS